MIKDCKGSYNRLIDKPELEVHREIIREHKTVDDMIEALEQYEKLRPRLNYIEASIKK